MIFHHCRLLSLSLSLARDMQVGFDPWKHMQRLEECFVSHASLHQRAGRAGRVRPGMSFSLLSLDVHEQLDMYVPFLLLRYTHDFATS